MYRFNKIKFDKVKTILVIFITIVFSVIYYFFNVFNDNVLINYIANNLLVQSIFIFLTLSSLINIFYPFTIRKEIGEKDIDSSITKLKKTLKEDEEFKKRSENTL